MASTPVAPRAQNPFTRSLVTLVAGIVIALGLNASFTLWQVQQSQHRWCAVMVTLDNADQHAKPTSQSGRNLFRDFHNLREEFGCGS